MFIFRAHFRPNRTILRRLSLARAPPKSGVARGLTPPRTVLIVKTGSIRWCLRGIALMVDSGLHWFPHPPKRPLRPPRPLKGVDRSSVTWALSRPPRPLVDVILLEVVHPLWSPKSRNGVHREQGRNRHESALFLRGGLLINVGLVPSMWFPAGFVWPCFYKCGLWICSALFLRCGFRTCSGVCQRCRVVDKLDPEVTSKSLAGHPHGLEWGGPSLLEVRHQLQLAPGLN